MVVFTWDPRLETGHPDIDRDHWEMFNLFNTLLEAMSQGKGRLEVEADLAFLERYILRHFAMEEQLMAGFAYTAQEWHRSQHRYMEGQVKDLIHRHRTGSGSLTLPLVMVLDEYLTHHILEEDRRLAQAIRKHEGAEPKAGLPAAAPRKGIPGSPLD
jgi:hemerythrin